MKMNAKEVIMLTNLGSPESPDRKGLKPYLNEFLMDERVIDLPYLLRYVLVKGIIVPLRAGESAKKYQTVWQKDGSPLIINSKKLQTLLQSKTDIPVYLSMRYGEPNTQSVLAKIYAENPNIERVTLVPLYPHYAMSSYETVVVQVKELISKNKYPFDLQVVPPFYNHQLYIESLGQMVAPYLEKEYDHILFSYHGIPERHVKKTDCTGEHCLLKADCCNLASEAHNFCYRHQVISTTRLVAEKIQIPPEKYSFAFQSRLGADAWLKPYTAATLKEMPSRGIKKLVVLCPSFVSDCLETLEEIAVEGKEIFLEHGGESFELIPCLNTENHWIDALNEIINHSSKKQETISQL